MTSDLTPIVIPLRSKRARRAQLTQRLQHVIPAALLLGNAMRLFRASEGAGARAFAFVEAALAVAFVASVIREVRNARKGIIQHPHGIDWPDVLVAGVFFGEGIERWVAHGHHKFLQPAFVTATGLLVLGLLHGRIFGAIDRHRSLRIDETGISMGKKPFGKFVAPWTAIKAIEIDNRYARIVKRDGGERRVDLNDIEDPAPVRAALEDARRRLLES